MSRLRRTQIKKAAARGAHSGQSGRKERGRQPEGLPPVGAKADNVERRNVLTAVTVAGKHNPERYDNDYSKHK